MNRRSLAPALGLGPGSVVSLVGAGGKTSLAFALASEAGEAWGWDSVLVTTTTHMFQPAMSDFPPLSGGVRAPMVPGAPPIPSLRLVLVSSLKQALAATVATSAGRSGELLVLATGIEPTSRAGQRDKIVGLPPEWVDAVARANPHRLIVVEADGSGRRPLKAPASHEPVIPSSTTVVLAVAGLDALNRPLDAVTVHRPEQVARLTGLRQGAAITPEAIATVLWHAEGCGRCRPPAARLVPVVNKVDGPEHLQGAELIVAALRQMGATQVLLTSGAGWPVLVDEGAATADGPGVGVSVVVLAAGASTRFGRPKQLLPWGGQTLVERMVGEALRVNEARKVVVVLGHEADQVTSALAALKRDAGARLSFVLNKDYLTQGQSSSVRAGIAALPAGTAAAIFVPVDQPLLTAVHLNALVARWAALAVQGDDRAIVAAAHAGRRGLPVLFAGAFFPELMQTEGDQGGRSVIRRHPEAVSAVEVGAGVLLDVDTPDDYSQLLLDHSPQA